MSENFTGTYVEREFCHSGLRCLVVATHLGHRCGYVEVPKRSPFFGVDYDHVPDPWHEVHGGVTYAGDRLGDGSWFVGFDCAHVGDGRDPAMERLFGSWGEKRAHADLLTVMMEGPMRDEHVWTEEEVAGECERLAEIVSSESKVDRYDLLEVVVANGALLLPEARREPEAGE